MNVLKVDDEMELHRCVADEKGYYVANVLVQLEVDEEADTTHEVIHGYMMPEGYSLVNLPHPNTEYTLRPKLNDDRTAWIEGAESLQELQDAKLLKAQYLERKRGTILSLVSAACSKAIYAGVDVETSEGKKHFSLELHDQTELIGLKPQLDLALEQAGYLTPSIPYHADGELCQLWTPEDFKKIYIAATTYIFYQRTYCNHLLNWIRRCDNLEELEGIRYGAELPEDLYQSMTALLEANGER